MLLEKQNKHNNDCCVSVGIKRKRFLKREREKNFKTKDNQCLNSQRKHCDSHFIHIHVALQPLS